MIDVKIPSGKWCNDCFFLMFPDHTNECYCKLFQYEVLQEVKKVDKEGFMYSYTAIKSERCLNKEEFRIAYE